MSTAAERLTARVKRHTTPLLVQTYLQSARAFDADPTGPDASTHEILLTVLDMELLHRDVPCCPECSVPTATGWHSSVLHNPAANQATDALMDAIATAAQP